MTVVYPDGTLTEPNFTDDWETYIGHKGVDYIDFDINRAVDDGQVIYAGYNPSGAGNEVRVAHADGTVTRYLHNASILVALYQWVSKGQALGVQGATGDATGKHLHFEARLPGYIPTPPRPWLRARLGSFAGGASKPILTNQEEISMNPRTFTTDGGKVFQIMFADGTSKPLIDYRTGLPMASAVVVALNLFLRYDKAYYPNGIRGAAVLTPEVAKQFSMALAPVAA